MTEADVIQPSASVASTGLGIRYIENYAYAYSGAVAVDENETALVETLSQTGIIVGAFQPQYFPPAAGDDYFFRFYLNDLLVIATALNSSLVATPYEKSPIIIPPLTLIKITAQNVTDTTANNVGAVLTGRVYGAE